MNELYCYFVDNSQMISIIVDCLALKDGTDMLFCVCNQLPAYAANLRSVKALTTLCRKPDVSYMYLQLVF
jgi:hypothetical protein